MGPQQPQQPQHHRRRRADLTLPSRAGWSNRATALDGHLGPARVQPVCPPSAYTSFPGPGRFMASPLWQEPKECHVHTHMQLTCVKHAHVCPHHHSPTTPTHCAPTQRNVHVPCACTHVQRHLTYTHPCTRTPVCAYTRPFPETHIPAATGTHNYRLMSLQGHTVCRVQTQV